MSYSNYADQGQAQLMILLKEKLAASQWKEADQLTKVLMLKISARKDDSYLYLDIDNCPDKEIKEIDQLWLDRSSHFGFSTQKDIYNRANYQQFITNVGWYKGDSWLSYDDLFFWEGNGPRGHLPYCGWHFWQGVYAPSTSSHVSNHKHSHQPHYHIPHRHGSDQGAAGAAALAGLGTFLPPVIVAAAVAGAGYLIYREVTKEERQKQERLEKEEAERKERQKRLEEENKVEKNIGTLLALV